VKNKALLLLVFTLSFISFAGLLRSRSHEILDGAIAVDLVARCELVIISPPLQPEKTIVFACPGKDMTRLWPLPVMTPWFEDWWEYIPTERSLNA
jgi:hypothetical protein